MSNQAAHQAYNLLTIADHVRLQRQGGDIPKGLTISFNKFSSLIDQKKALHASKVSKVPEYLIKSAKIIGEHVHSSATGRNVFNDLKLAYKLGLVNKDGMLLTNSQLQHAEFSSVR